MTRLRERKYTFDNRTWRARLIGPAAAPPVLLNEATLTDACQRIRYIQFFRDLVQADDSLRFNRLPNSVQHQRLGRLVYTRNRGDLNSMEVLDIRLVLDIVGPERAQAEARLLKLWGHPHVGRETFEWLCRGLGTAKYGFKM